MLLFLIFLLSGSQPPGANTPLQQGLLALRDGKLEDAKSAFQSALQQDPRNAFAWVSLAETCRRTGDTSTAINAAQRAEEFGRNLPAVDHALASFYTQQSQFAHAAKLEEQYAASAQADPQAGLRAAELYERADDPAGAQHALKSAWERRPNDPSVTFSYAQLLLTKLDFAAAQKVILPALQAHPKDPQLNLASGIADYGERRFPEAMDQFLKVIAIDPAISQPYQFLGKMLEQAGPKLPAITQVLEARLRNAPDDAIANLALAKAKLQSNSKDPAAEPLLRRAIATAPDDWEAHYELGVLLESRRDFDAAAEELTRSILLNARQSMPHYHLARVYDRLGRSEQAQAERKLHEQLANPQN